MVLGQRTTHYNPKNYKTLKKTIKVIKRWIPIPKKLKKGILNIKSSLDVYAFDYKITNIYIYLHDIIKSYWMKISQNPIKNKQPG